MCKIEKKYIMFDPTYKLNYQIEIDRLNNNGKMTNMFMMDFIQNLFRGFIQKYMPRNGENRKFFSNKG